MYNIYVQIDGVNNSGKIAAMVSGGVDSMVMLDLLVKSGADVFAVHVNHGIREEAVADCDFVQSYCAQKNIPFVKYVFDIPALSKQSGRSIETEARFARLGVIDELIKSGKASKAATAHHADDNAETLLMHILRGSGVDGLKGIEQSDFVIRPLLPYTREEIEEYARTNDIPYVEDKTNFDSKYTRNFIRLEVLPLIKSRYPGAVQSLNRLAQNAAEMIDALDAQLDLSLIKSENGVVKLSLDVLSSPLASRYVIVAAKRLMPVDITRVQVENVLKLAFSINGSKAELANGLKAYKEYDCITFCFDKEYDFCVPFKVGSTVIGDKIIKVDESKPQFIKGNIMVADIPDGCVFRPRREGDRFTPYGGKSKSLKKYLIDKKVPKRLRDSLVCLCDGSEVLAIVGMEISDKCKITADSKVAYLITLEECK